jgi:hemerythrin-like domain-containing protein
MKSTDLLLEDHKHLIAASDVLAQMAESVEGGQAVSEGDLADLLRFLNEFGDRHHQGKEEGVLFPALLVDPAQKHYHRLSGLIFEHERQRSLIEGLYDSLFTKNNKDFIYYARRLKEVLRGHIREEEEMLFPLVETTLSAADDGRIELEMKAYDKAWQERELSGHLRRLSDMELKYLATPSERKS